MNISIITSSNTIDLTAGVFRIRTYNVYDAGIMVVGESGPHLIRGIL